MTEDKHGFLYPSIDSSVCMECSICMSVCPSLVSDIDAQHYSAYAAINPNEGLRLLSSSGGIFSNFAERFINEGGIVFGARFNEDFEVVHSYTTDVDGLAKFRGSKYSQSIIGDSFVQVKEFLDNGTKVLFSGTPCQIKGLKLFLKKEYVNLLTVEVACHGVPSPLVWREYVNSLRSVSPLHEISFRDKRNGWIHYGLSARDNNGEEIYYERGCDNAYIQGFLNNLFIRPSCSKCSSKSGKSGADILLGDFWGIESIKPELFDDKGCSLVIAYSSKGKEYFESLGIYNTNVTMGEATRFNPCIVDSVDYNRYSFLFWHYFQRTGISALPRTLEILKGSRIKRMVLLVLAKLHLS